MDFSLDKDHAGEASVNSRIKHFLPSLQTCSPPPSRLIHENQQKAMSPEEIVLKEKNLSRFTCPGKSILGSNIRVKIILTAVRRVFHI